MIEKIAKLAEEMAALPGVRVDFTPFPSGAAMLDVFRDGRMFVLIYSPTQRFGVDEISDDEPGFTTYYSFTTEDFSSAAQQLRKLVADAGPGFLGPLPTPTAQPVAVDGKAG